MKRKLGWFGLGFAGAELAAAILPPLVCVPAAAFLVCLALLWIKRRRDSAIPVLGALCGLAWFLAFTLVWVRPVVKALAGQTVTCTAVVETDADASYSESRLRGTLRLTEIDGRAANVKVQCASFPGESAGERFTAKFALTELPDNKYRLSRQSKGVYLQAEYLGSYHPLDASRAPRFALYRLRQRWSATLRRWLPRQLGGIEAAMLLADKSRLDDSVQQAFRTAGVSHLLAVSGLHLALLCGLLGFGRKWKFYKPLILLRAAAALFYLLLTGMPVSVSRAGIVLLVALVGDFFLLPPDLLTSTSFAAILLLVCSAVPFLAAITNLTALVLSLWLKGLLWLVRCCAALPFASICLPQRYTLFALAVLGALAVCFWHARRLRLYLPAAALCTVLAVGLGVWMQRDVVQINLVGASNNPCVVCVQNGQAVVFFRGGESNWNAVQNYLAGRSRQEPALVVDLRAKPTQMEFSAAEIVTVQELAYFTTHPVLDGLTLDLYHNKSANLAVLGVGERHIAVGAGRLELAEPVRVDVLCAPGTLSDSVRPDAILYTAAAPRWLDDAAGCALRYGENTPGLTLRPGRSMIWEEAQTIAVQ